MKEIHLIEPSDQELDDAYRSLETGGYVSVKIETLELGNVLDDIEKSGFVAIEILNYNLGDLQQTIRGYKGKHGPCFDTGRQAKYIGSAKAVLDDDNHLLLADHYSLVCEKTARIFQFPPYKKLITATDGAAELIRRYKVDPQKFDKNTFDNDQAELFISLRVERKEESRTYAYYPGPFKILILSDGSMVRRGVVNNVPKDSLQQLARTDNLYEVQADEIIEAHFFQNEYAEKGSMCLLHDKPVTKKAGTEPKYQTNLKALSNLNKKLADRLKKLVRNHGKYFILTGSDPSDTLGCCPSDEVGEANRLVKEGILDSVSQETGGEACPVTIYAFKNEIKIHQDEIAFEIDKDFRNLVLTNMGKNKSGGFYNVIRWALVGFIILSTVLAVIRFKDSILYGIDERSPSLYDHFAPLHKNTTLILLFHNQTRCTMCLNMEGHIKTLLSQEYGEYQDKGLIQFMPVNMNSSENQAFVRRFELYTASVVLVRFKDREETDVVVLRDIWKLHTDRDKFTDEVNRELKVLLSD